MLRSCSQANRIGVHWGQYKLKLQKLFSSQPQVQSLNFIKAKNLAWEPNSLQHRPPLICLARSISYFKMWSKSCWNFLNTGCTYMSFIIVRIHSCLERPVSRRASQKVHSRLSVLPLYSSPPPFPSFLSISLISSLLQPLLYIITNYSESTMPIIYMSAHRECLTQTSYWRYHMLSLARSDVKIDPEVWASIIRLHYETKKHEKTEREMSQNFYMLGYSLVST